jgi:hypothetical protein
MSSAFFVNKNLRVLQELGGLVILKAAKISRAMTQCRVTQSGE